MLTQSTNCVKLAEMERDATTSQRRDEKRAAIHAAAIGEFASRGIAGTSMANIADAAGVSRPALYQYFQNKNDIFASAFIALFDEHVDRALAALDQPGPLAEQLDNLLQRYEGDLLERIQSSEHADEILGAKDDALATAIGDVVSRLWVGTANYLHSVAQQDGALAINAAPKDVDTKRRVEGWIELLSLGPKGLRWDEPAITTYRRRLTVLAQSVAADVSGTVANLQA